MQVRVPNSGRIDHLRTPLAGSSFAVVLLAGCWVKLGGVMRKAIQTVACPILAVALALPLLLSPRQADAACNTPNTLALTFSLPDYAFWKIAGDKMRECGNLTLSFGVDAVRVTSDPLIPDKDLGQLVGVSNASLVRLSSQGLLQPLDNLVEKYRDRLHERQFKRVDGKIMAIAVAGNTTALMVHADLLKQEEIDLPATFEDVFEAAGELEGGQLYEYPISVAYKPGWNLTQAFIDQFLANEGASLLDGENKPLVNGEAGVATLERIKRLSELMPEDQRGAGPEKVLDDLLKFRAPMGILWVSSAGPLENPAVSRVSGKMEVLTAPRILEGGRPAATLWWDGFAIPVNASPEQAEAAFVTALEGLDAEMLAEHRDDAFWLLKEYVPGRLARNALAAVDAGLPDYPASEPLNLLRRALSPRLAEFMKGEVTAAQALGLAEADYMQAARERGLEGF